MIKSYPLSALLNLKAIEAEEARRRFRDFIPLAWPIAEPSRPFIPNWHIDAIADHLQAVSDGRIKRLLITIPPGHAKSLLVSIFHRGDVAGFFVGPKHLRHLVLHGLTFEVSKLSRKRTVLRI